MIKDHAIVDHDTSLIKAAFDISLADLFVHWYESLSSGLLLFRQILVEINGAGLIRVRFCSCLDQNFAFVCLLVVLTRRRRDLNWD